MENMNLRNYAYIGDAIWEVFIREKTIKITENSKKLHKITTEKVKASFQAFLLQKLDEILTDEEKEIARRARNLPIPIGRRHIQVEYRHATAFEVLIGYFHEHDKERLVFVENYLEKFIEF